MNLSNPTAPMLRAADLLDATRQVIAQAHRLLALLSQEYHERQGHRRSSYLTCAEPVCGRNAKAGQRRAGR